jgi:hypothetical protein
MFCVRDLIWTDWNVEHIARHGVAPWEVEEMVYGRPYVSRGREGLYRLIGRTDSGRFLAAWLSPQGGGLFFVVTARDATARERTEFRRQGGS